MRNITWEIEKHSIPGCFLISIEGMMFVVPEEKCPSIYALLSIKDTLEKIHNRLIDMDKEDDR